VLQIWRIDIFVCHLNDGFSNESFFKSVLEYSCNTVGLDLGKAIDSVNNIPKLDKK
jgi:hypothetical protein